MADSAKAWEVSKAAFDAESNKNFDEALKLHKEALTLLDLIVHDGKLLQTEPVRLAKRQIKVHQGRVATLQAAKLSGATVTPLPSVQSFTQEVTQYLQRGKRDIGTEQFYLTHPRLLQSPELQHLVNKKQPPYAPTLDRSLPESTWYIDYETDKMLRHGGSYLYVKASREPKGEVHYVLQGFIERRKQNVIAEMFRTTDLRQRIMVAMIQPCKSLSDKWDIMFTGRPIGIEILGDTIVEKPDRIGKKGWTPRRFDFAGRRFVWNQEVSWLKGNNEELWEVEKEWPKPGSKTGKMEHSTYGTRLVWQTPGTFSSPYQQIHIAGGMGSLFEEYILASQMARKFVSLQND